MAETARFVIGAEASRSDGIQLTITKQEVEDLPPVDAGHPSASAGGGRESG